MLSPAWYLLGCQCWYDGHGELLSRVRHGCTGLAPTRGNHNGQHQPAGNAQAAAAGTSAAGQPAVATQGGRQLRATSFVPFVRWVMATFGKQHAVKASPK
jgi:hypothetical protein